MKGQTKEDTGQLDARKSWLFMIAYWLAGIMIGIQVGYLSSSTMTLRPFHIWHAVALATTIIANRIIDRRYGSFGRMTNWWAIMIFALCNGLCETVMFLASYDFGRKFASEMAGLSGSATGLVGFCTFSSYSGFIHARFWLPLVFPPHILPNAPPFHITALPALIACGATWLVLYEIFDDIPSCHGFTCSKKHGSPTAHFEATCPSQHGLNPSKEGLQSPKRNALTGRLLVFVSMHVRCISLIA